jgi:hypothetical protein
MVSTSAIVWSILSWMAEDYNGQRKVQKKMILGLDKWGMA